MNDSRPNQRRRVLFIAEAVTLAHVARPRALAEALDPGRYEVHLASASAFEGALAGLSVQRWPLNSIAPQRFKTALARGKPVYDVQTLTGYVEQDLALLDQVRPDLVVGDFRLSLAVSAPLRHTPYYALVNAYWSPYATLARWPIPELPIVRLLGEGLASQLFNRLRPLIFLLHGRPLNTVRRRFGLAPVGDMLRTYTWADETLYLDVPELVPTRQLPPTHRFIGPAIWQPSLPFPSWWNRLPTNRATIYVTPGSSGAARQLRGLLAELIRLPVNVLVATAGRLHGSQLPRGVWGADYLPGIDAAARADLVISNGGSGTGYQALSQGVPVLGIVSNLDQHLNMHYTALAGAGRVLRSEQATPGAVRATVEQMLSSDRYRSAAKEVQQWIGQCRAQDNLERCLVSG